MKLSMGNKKLIGAMALALAISPWAQALAGQKPDGQKPDARNQQILEQGFEIPIQSTGTGGRFIGNRLLVNGTGTGVYEGCIATRDCLKNHGNDREKIYLLIRRVMGREDSFLAVLMHPIKDHEKIGLYRIDPLSPGVYDMTRLTLDATGTYIGVEYVDPELTLQVVGSRIQIDPASEKMNRPGRYRDQGFHEAMQFDGESFFHPTPDVIWTDLRPGRYRGLHFSDNSDAISTAELVNWDPAGTCSSDEPCYESSAHFTMLKSQLQQTLGRRKLFERYPGMFTFNPVNTLKDGEHVSAAQSIGVFLSFNKDKKVGLQEEKLYMIDPLENTRIDVMKKAD